MLVVAGIVAATCAASAWMLRRMRQPVERSFKALAPAVPDARDEADAGYRQGPLDTSTTALAKKSLELLPESQWVMRGQQLVGLLAGPLAALGFGLFPIAALGSWSAAIGAAWGLALGGATLKDERRGVDLLALATVPLATLPLFFATYPIGPLLTALAIYTGARKIFDWKDAAGIQESNRERLADPKYLSMSTERRAAAIARSRGGSSSGDAASARDNLTAT